MRYYIVIPAHNEAAFITQTLDSIVSQTKLPEKVVVVNDNSSDNTEELVLHYTKKHTFISLVNSISSNIHLPGSKVINAFYKGFETLDDAYDCIIKLDADIVLPDNYLEMITQHFRSDAKIGMVGGFAYIEKNNQWVLENLTNKDHIRGAFKAYRKACFKAIGGLKTAMGWDTVDELLAQYHGWKIKTDENLKVKHLKPTGANYNKTARLKQGEAFYRLRYGLIITTIAGLKLALKKGKPLLFIDYISGFLNAKKNGVTYFVSETEGKFIRNLRWKNMRKKIF